MKEDLFELEVQNLAIDIVESVRRNNPKPKQKEILFTKFKIYNKKDYIGTVLKECSVRNLLKDDKDLNCIKEIKYNDDSIESISYSLSLF